MGLEAELQEARLCPVEPVIPAGWRLPKKEAARGG